MNGKVTEAEVVLTVDIEEYNADIDICLFAGLDEDEDELVFHDEDLGDGDLGVVDLDMSEEEIREYLDLKLAGRMSEEQVAQIQDAVVAAVKRAPEVADMVEEAVEEAIEEAEVEEALEEAEAEEALEEAEEIVEEAAEEG